MAVSFAEEVGDADAESIDPRRLFLPPSWKGSTHFLLDFVGFPKWSFLGEEGWEDMESITEGRKERGERRVNSAQRFDGEARFPI